MPRIPRPQQRPSNGGNDGRLKVERASKKVFFFRRFHRPDIEACYCCYYSQEAVEVRGYGKSSDHQATTTKSAILSVASRGFFG